MLVTLEEILKDAEERKYGVGLFNMLNMEMARGIIEAAEEMRSPLILGVAEVHLPSVPFTYAKDVMMKIAKESSVPVCLHFDHGTDPAKIYAALQAGFTSVMYDGSSLPYEENVRATKEISVVAHALGASVEAELGHVGGEEDATESEAEEALYTNPAEVNDFIDRADVDALAVAIGTAHGVYRKKPKLDLARLAEIYRISKKPLVLHGGSGLTDDDFRNTVANGIRKINICTEMCRAEHLAFARAYEQGVSFEKAVIAAKDAVKAVVVDKMQVFGSQNKA